MSSISHIILILMIPGFLVLGTVSDGYAELITNSSDRTGQVYTYSIVHLSDTQNLASYYPDTYNYTFTYLDSLNSQYNISAIIITGDLVNNYDNLTEWQTYANAVNRTSIPIYVTAGNHDTNAGKDDRNYGLYTGNNDRYYLTSINDCNLVGISYVKKTLPASDLQQIKTFLETSPHQVTIIATHYYMDPDGDFSRLGKSINQDLIVSPTILMTGHKHVYAPFITRIQIGSYPVIEDLADFQDGVKGPTGDNYAAGTLYSITVEGGKIHQISTRSLQIYPDQIIGPDQVVFQESDVSA